MKISYWLKVQGHHVELQQLLKGDYLHRYDIDIVWISCVFTWNREQALILKSFYESFGITVLIGGSGISLRTKLPNQIEDFWPDYSLYGDDRAIGFVLRGCIRKCDFCLVSEKEGKITDNIFRSLDTWIPQGFNKVLLLDNEFAAYDPVVYPKIHRDIEKETLDLIKQRKWKYSITQGYDLRCLDKRKAEQLADNKPYDLKFTEHRLYVAWDYLGIEPYVRRGLKLLLDAGFLGREIMCYCLVGQRSTHADDLHRFNVLWKEFGVLPFMMRYRPLDGSPPKSDKWLSAFCRYVNRGPASYRDHSFEDYIKFRHLIF